MMWRRIAVKSNNGVFATADKVGGRSFSSSQKGDSREKLKKTAPNFKSFG